MYVENVDAVYQRALEAGAVSLYQPVDQTMVIAKPASRTRPGNQWFIATHQGPGYVPEGLHSVTPGVRAQGASQYIDFLKRAFRAEEGGAP